MSNSVIFLLIAVGLSVLGTLVVWLQGRPRRPKSSVEVFNRSLRALATDDTRHEPLSGVTVRPVGGYADDVPVDGDDGYDDHHAYGDHAQDNNAYDDHAQDNNAYDNNAFVGDAASDARDTYSDNGAYDDHGVYEERSPRPSPRPRPRPAAPRRGPSNRQGADPGA